MMRVISGTLKGRMIHTVPSAHTRPTSDKIKEAVFHVMGPYFDGGHALDLFAGSGALGIEAISRGMESVTFIDRSHDAIKTIKKNVQSLQIEDRALIYRNDAMRALTILSHKKSQFDLIFIDPPYDSTNYSSILEKIKQSHIANPGCFVYVEYPPEKDVTYDEQYYDLFFQRDYSKAIATMILKIKQE